MVAQSRAESTWDIYNYGKYINQFLPNTIKSIRQYERINKKICLLCSTEYTCIYIYICVCVCVFQSAIVLSSFSRSHPVHTQSCVSPYSLVKTSAAMRRSLLETLFMSSSLLLQQCPTVLFVLFRWFVGCDVSHYAAVVFLGVSYSFFFFSK